MSKTNDFDLLLDATRNAFKALFKEHNENFYFATLILSEDGTSFISALSEEVLEKLSEKYPDDDLEDYKWSYADSPYCGYGFEEYFGELDKVFFERMESISTDKRYEKEIKHWLFTMANVMKTLDEEKIFGEGEKRDKMIINTEIMPPEESNAKRAKRLNKKSTYEKWYEDNFSDSSDTVDMEYIKKVAALENGAEFIKAIDKMSPTEVEALNKYFEELKKLKN